MFWGTEGSKPTETAAATEPTTGKVVNGLFTLLEPEAIAVKPENLAAFTLPAEALFFDPPTEAIVSVFKNGDRERKIYNNIETDETEQRNVRQLQEDARKQNLAYMPSITSMCGRYLSRARGDTTQALKLMVATQEWRTEFFGGGPLADEAMREDLAHGIVYFCGRDSALRPTLVIRAARIPESWYKEKRIEKLIHVLIFCMEYMLRYMLIPGRVENNTVVVDLKGLSLTQVPIAALKDVYKVMSHHYMGRVFRFYICNASWTLMSIASVVKSILTDRQRQKLVFVDNVKDMAKDWAADQLEEDLGGRRPVDKGFFPFPLQPGPFEGGCLKPADQNAPRNLHEAIPQDMMFGRVWDPSLTPAENKPTPNIEPRFIEILKRYGIVLPRELLNKAEASHNSAGPAANPSTSGVTVGVHSAETSKKASVLEPEVVKTSTTVVDDITPTSTAPSGTTVPITEAGADAPSRSTTAPMDSHFLSDDLTRSRLSEAKQPALEIEFDAYESTSCWSCKGMVRRSKCWSTEPPRP
eukprot:TRINITY_DN24639_c0_g1_i1.p1 TRINITY_DN24639_c0_g1~~TRINITY_DN24639_c0_g1_i1.p1  ORF type:complete len:526 (+),score=74.31 TRINITY_DN24639_c0_g1_i1:397-1974(+)